MNRLKARIRIPERTRRAVLESFCYSCALCLNPFEFPQIHHIRFVSLRGGNEPENLLPLCPSCHTLPHRLPQVFSESTIKEVRRRAVESGKIKTLLLGRRLSEDDLVRAVTTTDIRYLVSTSGWYTQFSRVFAESFDYIDGQASLVGKCGREVNKALLTSLIGETFLYSNIEGTISKGMFLLEKVYELFRNIRDFSDTAAYVGTVMSKGYELARQRVREKDILLDVGDIDMSTQTTRNFWLWRSMSYEMNVGKLGHAARLKRQFLFGGETNFGRQVESNALSIMPHLDVRQGHGIDKAIEMQKIGLKNAVDIFHKRGIYFRSFNLARLYLRREDYSKAAGYLKLAGLLKDCGYILNEWDAQSLYIKISKALGPDEYFRILHRAKIPDIHDI